MGFIHMVAVSQDRREPQEILGNRHYARCMGISLTNRPVGDDIAHLMTTDSNTAALESLAKAQKEAAQTIAEGLKDIASALRSLGNGSSHAPGAIEFVGMALRDGLAPIADAIRERE